VAPACPPPIARHSPVDIGVARVEGLDSDDCDTTLSGELGDADEHPAEEGRRELRRKDADDQPVIIQTRKLAKESLLHRSLIDLLGNPLELHLRGKMTASVTVIQRLSAAPCSLHHAWSATALLAVL